MPLHDTASTAAPPILFSVITVRCVIWSEWADNFCLFVFEAIKGPLKTLTGIILHFIAMVCQSHSYEEKKCL